MTDKKAKEIGERIKHYRLKAGLSQVGLEELADVKSNTIARLERGEHRATTQTIEKLAKALGIENSDIFS